MYQKQNTTTQDTHVARPLDAQGGRHALQLVGRLDPAGDVVPPQQVDGQPGLLLLLRRDGSAGGSRMLVPTPVAAVSAMSELSPSPSPLGGGGAT